MASYWFMLFVLTRFNFTTYSTLAAYRGLDSGGGVIHVLPPSGPHHSTYTHPHAHQRFIEHLQESKLAAVWAVGAKAQVSYSEATTSSVQLVDQHSPSNFHQPNAMHEKVCQVHIVHHKPPHPFRIKYSQRRCIPSDV